MQRGLNELKATAWISGIRREQSESRKYRPVVEKQNNWIKIYPIIDWDEQQVESYMKEFNLPPHPLKSKGYVLFPSSLFSNSMPNHRPLPKSVSPTHCTIAFKFRRTVNKIFETNTHPRFV